MATVTNESQGLLRLPRMEVFGFELLKEKTALVTGASRGIGRAVATALADAGADVAVNFRSSSDSANEVCAAARRMGVRARCYQADVARSEDVTRLVDEVQGDFGSIDILVNNAGITRDKSFLKMTTEMWDEVLETNLRGPALLTRTVLPGMVERKWGRVINVTSIVGQVGNFGQANYAAAKGGLIALTKTLRAKRRGRGSLSMPWHPVLSKPT